MSEGRGGGGGWVMDVYWRGAYQGLSGHLLERGLSGEG